MVSGQNLYLRFHSILYGMEYNIVKIFVLVSLFVCVISGRQCKNEDCSGRPDKTTGIRECSIDDVPEDGKIVSIDILETKGRSRCVFNDNYGFHTRSIWVSKKCKAEFVVCFINDSEDDNTSPLNNKTTARKSIDVEKTTVSTALNKITTTPDDEEREQKIYDDRITENTPNSVNSTNSKRLKVDGLTPTILGGLVGGLLFIILLLVIVIVSIRRCKCCQRIKRPVSLNPMQGHRSITSTVSQLTTLSCGEDGYDTLTICREGHQYKECKDTSQPHTYTTIYDSIDDVVNKSAPAEDSTHSHVTKPEDKNNFIGEYIDISNGAKGQHNIEQITSPQYNTLDSSETGFHKGLPTSNCKQSTVSSLPNEKTESDSKKQQEGSSHYNILDKAETGFYKGSAIDIPNINTTDDDKQYIDIIN